jgi:hypothetical protein
MKVNLLGFLVIGYFAFIATGCEPRTAPNAPKPPTDPSPERAVVSETPTIPAMPTQNEETQPLPIPGIASLEPLIEKAKADLAQRLSIPASQINVTETKQVFWPDASLGCPQPGITYTHVEVPGYLIILESNGNEFEYHANIHGYIFYCENPTPPILETPTNGQP